jgi:uncharacterized membrane protein YjjP (DUF1212 family)
VENKTRLFISIISIFLLSILISLLITNQIIYSTISFINLLFLIYSNKYIQRRSLINKDYRVNIFYKTCFFILYIPKINYKNIKIDKEWLCINL